MTDPPLVLSGVLPEVSSGLLPQHIPRCHAVNSDSVLREPHRVVTDHRVQGGLRDMVGERLIGSYQVGR